jgi:VWFA-related protein
MSLRHSNDRYRSRQSARLKRVFARESARPKRGFAMKAILTTIFLALSAALLLLPLGERLARAQSPAGPGGAGQTTPQQQTPTQPQQQQKPPEAGASINVEVPVVTLDVIAATQHGDILTGLKRENFRVVDDGAPQTVTGFGATDAPITIAMVMEFSSRGYFDWFAYQAKYWSEAFFPNLKQKDWVALVTFDMKSRVEVDFTQNKDEVRQAIYHMYFPGFSESNVFDAVLTTIDQMKDIKGKKSMLLLATGVDTFSKHTLDQTMKELRQSDVTIFSVGLDKPYINFIESHGNQGSHMNYLQGENQLKTFSQLTGGYAWFPQFDGEIPDIFRQVVAFLRNQYSLSYTPTTGANDGKFHKVKIELVQPDGSPLIVNDQKGKKQKVVVYAREGYTAVKGGVGD